MIEVKRLEKDEWALLSESAHIVAFNEHRPASFNRIDFALLFTVSEVVQGYITVRELDAESVYFQYGGKMPGVQVAFECFKKALEYCAEQGFKRVNMYVKNDNFPMLKFVLAEKFKGIGVRTFNNEVFLEMFKEIRSA